MMQLRIMDQIYSFQSNVAISATSQDPEFPATNLGKTFRSKVWRSAGYFEITASNAKVDFKESSGGAQKTATLTVGSYTPAGLATEIQTRLNAAGTVAYTVTYSAVTGLWTIASAGAYLSILWNTGTNAASSVASSIGFNASFDSTGALTYTGALIALHSYEAAVIDLLTATPVDSVCILFDPSSPINLTGSAQLRIQASATSNFSSLGVDQALTVDYTFSAATFFFTTDQNYRYWRLKVIDPANPSLYIEIPSFLLAKATQLSYLPSFNFTFGQLDTSKPQRTDYGHEYVDSYPIQKSLSINYAGLPYSDLLTLNSVYQRVTRSRPFVVALDPMGGSFNQNHYLLFGKWMNSFDLSGIAGGNASAAIQIAEVNG